MTTIYFPGVLNISFPDLERFNMENINKYKIPFFLDNVKKLLNTLIDDENDFEMREIYLKLLELYQSIDEIKKNIYNRENDKLKKIACLEKCYKDVQSYIKENRKENEILTFLDDVYFSKQFKYINLYINNKISLEELTKELQKPNITCDVLYNCVNTINDNNIIKNIVKFEKHIFYFDQIKFISYFYLLKNYSLVNKINVKTSFSSVYDDEIIKNFNNVNVRFYNIISLYLYYLDNKIDTYLTTIKRDILEFEKKINRNILDDLQKENNIMVLQYKDNLLVELYKNYDELRDQIQKYNLYPDDIKKIKHELSLYIEEEKKKYSQLLLNISNNDSAMVHEEIKKILPQMESKCQESIDHIFKDVIDKINNSNYILENEIKESVIKSLNSIIDENKTESKREYSKIIDVINVIKNSNEDLNNQLITLRNVITNVDEKNTSLIERLNEFWDSRDAEFRKKIDSIYNELQLKNNDGKLKLLEEKIQECCKIRNSMDFFIKSVREDFDRIDDRLKLVENFLRVRGNVGGCKNDDIQKYKLLFKDIIGNDILITKILEKYEYLEKYNRKINKINNFGMDHKEMKEIEKCIIIKKNIFMRNINSIIKKEKRKKFFGNLDDYEILSKYNDLPDNNTVKSLYSNEGTNPIKYGNYNFYKYRFELPRTDEEFDIVDIRDIENLNNPSVEESYRIIEIVKKRNSSMNELRLVKLYNEFLIAISDYIQILKKYKNELVESYENETCRYNIKSITVDRKKRNKYIYNLGKELVVLTEKIKNESRLGCCDFEQVYRYCLKFLKNKNPYVDIIDKEKYLNYIFLKSKEKTVTKEISNTVGGSYAVYFFNEELPTNDKEIDFVCMTSLSKQECVDYMEKVKDINYYFPYRKDYELLKNFYVFKNEYSIYKNKLYDIKMILVGLQEEIYKLIIAPSTSDNIFKFKKLKEECIKLADERKKINVDFYFVREEKRNRDIHIFSEYIKKHFNKKNYYIEISKQANELISKKF